MLERIIISFPTFPCLLKRPIGNFTNVDKEFHYNWKPIICQDITAILLENWILKQQAVFWVFLFFLYFLPNCHALCFD